MISQEFENKNLQNRFNTPSIFYHLLSVRNSFKGLERSMLVFVGNKVCH